jgi:hypothetical protein
MKISWGTKIAGLYIGFVVMMISLVTATSFNKPDLVAEDYYAQEIAFQKRLDATRSGNALKEAVQIEKTAEEIIIRFPDEFRDKLITGELHFYAPAGSAADRRIPLQTSDNGCVVSRKSLARVPYEVRISWTVSGKDYYQANSLDLQ